MENTRSDRHLISSKQNTQSIILRSFKFLLTIHSFHLVDLSMRLFTGNIWSDSEKAADSLCQDFVRGERQLQCEPTCCRREPVMKNAFHQTSLVTRQFCPDISCDFVHRQITKIQEFSELLHDFFPITYYAWLYTFPEKSYDPQILSRKVLQLYSGHPNVSIHRVICLKICCESSGWTVSVEKSSSAKIDFPPKSSLNSNNLLNSLPIVCLALTFATNCNIRTIQQIVWIKESLKCQGNKYWSNYIPQKEGCGPIKDREIIW